MSPWPNVAWPNVAWPNVALAFGRLAFGRAIIYVPKRNIRFVLLFYMQASKSRPQYGSIDTSNTNIRPLVTIS